MAYSNGQITAPVDASDPYDVMCVGQYNGTFDVGHICGNTHGKINKWSKRKPIVYDTIEELTTLLNIKVLSYLPRLIQTN